MNIHALTLGLYLPAAGQKTPPFWLEEFTTAKPKIGLLQLNYRAIAEQLRGGHNNEYVAKLIRNPRLRRACQPDISIVTHWHCIVTN